jgi:hypothetical protein
MSVSSILAFVLAGVAVKNRRASSDVGDKTHPRFIAGYEAGLSDGKLEARARIAELEDDIARANAQARRDQELIDMWREFANTIPPASLPRPAGPDFRPPHIAALQQQAALQQIQMQQAQLQSLAHSQQAQYNAQQAMNAQNFYAQSQFGQAQLGQAVGLLGAQNLIDAELWCNCVPSRSQVWATSDPE